MANRQRTRQSLGISDLPRNVIDSILERLPLTDAIMISIASKKFRRFWLTLPHVAFDYEFWEEVLQDDEFDHLMFRDIVSGVLLSHIGPVTKFSLRIPDFFSGRGPCNSQWVSFLSRNGIKDLTIENSCFADTEVPSALFACLDLVKLHLDFFRFSPPPSFKGFWKLECLVLRNITFTSDGLGSLIANSPRLEVLSLMGYIQTTTINAPKLKSLSISSSSFLSICLSNVTNLVSVSITSSWDVHIFDKGTTRNMIKTLATSCKLEKLNFGYRFWKLLGASGISEMLPTTFHYVRYLELSSIDLNDRNGASCAVGIIRSCPNMVKLEISVFPKIADAEHELDYYNHDVVLNHLRYARIKCIRGWSTELKLIDYVFASSPMLEEFSVVHDVGLQATAIIAMSEKLMRLSRASTRAKVIFKGPCSLVMRT